jgi:hypothetical protein
MGCDIKSSSKTNLLFFGKALMKGFNDSRPLHNNDAQKSKYQLTCLKISLCMNICF